MSDLGKGTPFDPVLKSYLRIEELRLNPKRYTLKREYFSVPNEYEPIKPDKRINPCGPKPLPGLTTKLSRRHFLGALILRNEMLGCIGKAACRDVLMRQMKKEYPKWEWSALRKFFTHFSHMRSQYNTGALYKNQSVPPLYCFYWNPDGYIRHNRFPSQLLSFRFCKRHLNTVRFADPRFFTPSEISVITNNQIKGDEEANNWHVPSLPEIQAIEAEINKPVFDSIEFPPGYGKEHNPI